MFRKHFTRLFVLIFALVLLLSTVPASQASDLYVERQVFAFLTTDLGLNSAAACGILANIEAESNFSLSALGDGGTSYGLFQWHATRFDALKSFCILNGYDYSSVEGQMNFLAYELRTTFQNTYAAMRRVEDSSDGAYQAAYYWCVYFEAPANREQAGVTRGRNAQFKYWTRYGGTVIVDSKGYTSPPTPWTGSISFYWETEEDEPAQTVTQAPAASSVQEYTPQQPQPAAQEAAQPETGQHAAPRIHYTPHHLPGAAVSLSAVPAQAPGSPLACLFFCAGEPAQPCRLPDPEESEEEAEEEETIS